MDYNISFDSSTRPKVLIVDDHPIFLEGIADIIQEIFPNAVILLASGGQHALDLVAKQPGIDWVFLDISLPDISGLTLLRTFADTQLLAPVIIVSSDDDPETLDKALNAGATGFISKSSQKSVYQQCMLQINQGQLYIEPDAASRLQQYRQVVLAERQRIVEALSPRQSDVLVLLSKGYSNAEIGQALNVSESTIKTHVSSVIKLLDADNRTHCVVEAQRLQILS